MFPHSTASSRRFIKITKERPKSGSRTIALRAPRLPVLRPPALLRQALRQEFLRPPALLRQALQQEFLRSPALLRQVLQQEFQPPALQQQALQREFQPPALQQQELQREFQPPALLRQALQREFLRLPSLCYQNRAHAASHCFATSPTCRATNTPTTNSKA